MSKERITVWTRSTPGGADWSYQYSFGTYGLGFDQFENPVGISVSADNLTAFVSDVGNHRISLWKRSNAGSPAWNHQATFGTNGGDANQLFYPYRIVASADGSVVFVADSGNSRVSVWTRAWPG